MAKNCFPEEHLQEHECSHHSKWNCLAKSSVFWNGYDTVIVLELIWLCWKTKKWINLVYKNVYWYGFEPRFWFPISFVPETVTFSSGISVFHFLAVLENSSLITAHCVFFWKSDCLNKLIIRYRTNSSFCFLGTINCDNKSLN